MRIRRVSPVRDSPRQHQLISCHSLTRLANPHRPSLPRKQGADAIMEALKLSLAPLEAINVSGNQMSAPAKRALQHVAASVRGKMPSLSVQVED